MNWNQVKKVTCSRLFKIGHTALLILLFPILIIGTAITVNYFTGSIMATLLAAIAVLGVNIVVRSYKDISRHEDLVRTSLSLLTMGIITLYVATELNPHMFPLGTIGWTITLGVCVVLIVWILSDNYDSYRSFLGNAEAWMLMAYVPFMVIIASQVVAHWATLYVLIPLAVFSMYSFLIHNREFNWDEDSSTQTLSLYSLPIGIVSIICQFWFAPIVWGYNLWQILLGLVILACAILIGWLCVHVIQKRKSKRYANEQNRIRNKEAEEKKKVVLLEKRRKEEDLRLRIEEFNKAEKLSCYKLLNLISESDNTAIFTFQAISRLSLLELFEVSEVKKQIGWNGGDLEKILKLMEGLIAKSLKDEWLEPTIAQVKSLEKFSGYTGYSSLRDAVMKHEAISEHVQLKKPDKKK